MFLVVCWCLLWFENGLLVGYLVQFCVSGDSIVMVCLIVEKVVVMMCGDVCMVNVQFDWDELVECLVCFVFDQKKVCELNVMLQDVLSFFVMMLFGMMVMQYCECDKLIVVDLCVLWVDCVDLVKFVGFVLLMLNGFVLFGFFGCFMLMFEYGVVWECDCQLIIIVQLDVCVGVQGIDVMYVVDVKLNVLCVQLLVGYQINIGGLVEESVKVQKLINVQMLLMVIVVFMLLMIQLQSFLCVLMVVLIVLFGLIGVVVMLLLFGQLFGFVVMFGVIVMFGIIMCNLVILVDQIEQDIVVGYGCVDVIIGVIVWCFWLIMFMVVVVVFVLILLLCLNFFGLMVIVLMGGIMSVIVLILFYLFVLYVMWFCVKCDECDLQDGLLLGGMFVVLLGV